MMDGIKRIISLIPTPQDVSNFTITIPKTDTLHEMWVTTIIIGVLLIAVGLLLRSKKVNKIKASNITLIAGAIVVLCQGCQLLMSVL